MNEFNECVHEVFSAAGDIIIKSMRVYYKVKDSFTCLRNFSAIGVKV